jgi:hypothetical protein
MIERALIALAALLLLATCGLWVAVCQQPAPKLAACTRIQRVGDGVWQLDGCR